MGFELRKGISFCEVSGRLLFLDIVADRYLCLQPSAEHAFRCLLTNTASEPAPRCNLAGMLGSGMLIETSDHRLPAPFRAGQQASLSVLDSHNQHVATSNLIGALASIIGARLGLRRGLHPLLRALDLAKISWPHSGAVDLNAIQAAAWAFESTSRILRSHDKCLSRSIALARYLAARGLPADLLIGVRLRPFAAHAWVQSGRWLVNDRIDTVRSYTPILSV